MRQLAFCGGAAALFVVLLGAHANAQNMSPWAEQPPDAPRIYRTTNSRIAIARNIHIAADEEVLDAVVVVAGSARVDGRVRGDLIVVGGSIDLGPQADVRGDVVVVGGGLSRTEGARLHGSVSDVSFGEWRPFTIGGWWIPGVDFGDFGRWLTLFGAVFRISLLAILMAFALILARGRVARIGRAAATEPGRALALGLAAEILFIPGLIIASIALAVTIIGIPLIVVLVPLAMLAAFVTLVLGFTAMACRFGEWLEDRLGWRGHSALVAAAFGLILIVGPSLTARVLGLSTDSLGMVSWGLLTAGILLEFVVWTMGLGATLMTGFGRWSTAPPPVPTVPAPPATLATPLSV